MLTKQNKEPRYILKIYVNYVNKSVTLLAASCQLSNCWLMNYISESQTPLLNFDLTLEYKAAAGIWPIEDDKHVAE